MRWRRLALNRRAKRAQYHQYRPWVARPIQTSHRSPRPGTGSGGGSSRRPETPGSAPIANGPAHAARPMDSKPSLRQTEHQHASPEYWEKAGLVPPHLPLRSHRTAACPVSSELRLLVRQRDLPRWLMRPRSIVQRLAAFQDLCQVCTGSRPLIRVEKVALISTRINIELRGAAAPRAVRAAWPLRAGASESGHVDGHSRTGGLG